MSLNATPSSNSKSGGRSPDESSIESRFNTQIRIFNDYNILDSLNGNYPTNNKKFYKNSHKITPKIGHFLLPIKLNI